MDASEQIQRMGEFLDKKKAEIAELIRKKELHLNISFSEISRFDPELAEELLDNPEDILQAGNLAIKNINSAIKNFYLRFKDLPKSAQVKVREIRSSHIGKFVSIDGVVRQKSDVRPQVTIAKFECPACGNVISVPQLDTKFHEPTRCGCGRKGKFKILEKELVDAQGIVLEENPEKLEGGEQPKRINLFLKADLVSPLSEKRTNPGMNILVTGQIKEVPIISRTGAPSTRFDLMVDINHVEPKEESFHELSISKKQEDAILELSKDPHLLKKMIAAVAPSIYGHDLVKEALLIQLFSGVNKKRSDGVITRGDIHILLIGDPGCGKSQLLKRANIVAPKSRYVSGKGASGAGLTASVVKDEFLQGWSLEAGALVLASDGLCCIDELDKMTTEDRSAMHEALEQQTVSISKANIQATLTCKTTVLAAANPKLGRFDPYSPIVTQIDLPPPLISRFDLIFPLRDLPDSDKDTRLASHILSLHQNPNIEEPEINTELLRQYVAYSKRINPVLTDGAMDELKRYYVNIRNKTSDESGSKSVPITARQLEALVRLSEGMSRMKLSNKVTRKEAKMAIELLHNCLSQVGVDPETGKIDTDIITTGISTSQRGKIIQIKEIVADLENRLGKPISLENVVKEAGEKDISRSACEEAIEKLRRSGDIFEPKPGFIQRL
ncbi:minichromosome maintenance protein MCM [Candidatus Woesearchaeota archaeon]|jgi:replicative DNA helicase Mcm|nr:minichromosome maintenance protein MCM [Candidatus Woesearchaeota archaeon]MBT4367765.1 minichromosome maintenance protein MCM [Candidatus Woesearchaeota archaeon]MBT4712253.1 minichromosome maintenance protein MCM [Candidatus Woesearchaeota archaeon]MBT6638801.1 minichromosome maintenance protein MCM [Candidatus Woesearchaeota archaeon]MBT7134445.1 minichromosome maintenance protein MCM [Candidatus Woesearchaeota archaeon]